MPDKLIKKSGREVVANLLGKKQLSTPEIIKYQGIINSIDKASKHLITAKQGISAEIKAIQSKLPFISTADLQDPHNRKIAQQLIQAKSIMAKPSPEVLKLSTRTGIPKSVLQNKDHLDLLKKLLKAHEASKISGLSAKTGVPVSALKNKETRELLEKVIQASNVTSNTAKSGVATATTKSKATQIAISKISETASELDIHNKVMNKSMTSAHRSIKFSAKVADFAQAGKQKFITFCITPSVFGRNLSKFTARGVLVTSTALTAYSVITCTYEVIRAPITGKEIVWDYQAKRIIEFQEMMNEEANYRYNRGQLQRIRQDNIARNVESYYHKIYELLFVDRPPKILLNSELQIVQSVIALKRFIYQDAYAFHKFALNVAQASILWQKLFDILHNNFTDIIYYGGQVSFVKKFMDKYNQIFFSENLIGTPYSTLKQHYDEIKRDAKLAYKQLPRHSGNTKENYRSQFKKQFKDFYRILDSTLKYRAEIESLYSSDKSVILRGISRILGTLDLNKALQMKKLTESKTLLETRLIENEKEVYVTNKQIHYLYSRKFNKLNNQKITSEEHKREKMFCEEMIREYDKLIKLSIHKTSKARKAMFRDLDQDKAIHDSHKLKNKLVKRSELINKKIQEVNSKISQTSYHFDSDRLLTIEKIQKIDNYFEQIDNYVANIVKNYTRNFASIAHASSNYYTSSKNKRDGDYSRLPYTDAERQYIEAYIKFDKKLNIFCQSYFLPKYKAIYDRIHHKAAKNVSSKEVYDYEYIQFLLSELLKDVFYLELIAKANAYFDCLRNVFKAVRYMAGLSNAQKLKIKNNLSILIQKTRYHVRRRSSVELDNFYKKSEKYLIKLSKKVKKLHWDLDKEFATIIRLQTEVNSVNTIIENFYTGDLISKSQKIKQFTTIHPNLSIKEATKYMENFFQLNTNTNEKINYLFESLNKEIR